MRTRFSRVLLIVLGTWVLAAWPAHADDYTLDPMHAAATFKISHIGLSYTHGRFNDLAGAFTVDPDAGKCSFSLTIKTASVDTANKKRDAHLRSPDFFNVKQYPTIAFKSKTVKAIKNGYQVTGDLTLHGETKSVTFDLVGGRQAEFPKGVKRTGFSTELTIKRSDFGMNKFKEGVGDEVFLSLSFEGTRK